jgi:hypothetical protein
MPVQCLDEIGLLSKKGAASLTELRWASVSVSVSVSLRAVWLPA